MQVFSLRVILFVALCTYALGCRERSFVFVNNCRYKVWPAMWYAHAGTATNNGDGWELASGVNMTYCAANNWSGRIWPRTGCTFNSAGECANNQACCTSGNCINSQNHWGLKCAQPSGPGPTLAEFTLINHSNPPYADFYDVSMVDGANIPVEIQPIRGTFTPSGNPYTCGSPGCTARTCPNSFALNRCSWYFNAGIYSSALLQTHPSYCTSNTQCKRGNCNFQTSTCPCSTDNDCLTGQKCGSTFIPGIGLTRTCGIASGYFTADAMCLLSNYGSPLNCSAQVPGQGTNTNLYACNGPNALSCLTDGARPTCCGCPSWMPAGDCKNTNPAWNRIAEPPTKIFKDACPTAYSYPYDDSTSTFTCGSNVGVSYTITFCPAGSPGAR